MHEYISYRAKNNIFHALLSLAMGIVIFGLMASHVYAMRIPYDNGGGDNSDDLGRVRIRYIKEFIPQVRVINWNNYDFMGQPTITKDVFTNILSVNHSPAAYEASGMFDAIVRYGVDPNLVLEIYFQESGYGVNGNFRKNICNLEYGQGVPRYGRFADYRKVRYPFVKSADDCAANIARWYGRGVHNVFQLIGILTPPYENNTAAYEKGVKNRMGQNNSVSIALHPPIVRYFKVVY